MVNDLIAITPTSLAEATSTFYLYCAHLAVLVIGLGYTGIIAANAFGRRVVFGNLPTFPKYMTRRSQYLAGLWCFVLVSMLAYFLLVYLNSEVTPAIGAFYPELYKKVQPFIENGSPSYFLIVVLMALVFIGLLHWENEPNPIVIFRNTIQIWIRIPFLVQRIAYLVKNSLAVPAEAIDSVVGYDNTPSVHKDDYEKHPQTIDRQWAEVSYIKWWLDKRNDDEDGTFFGEDSFGWIPLQDEYRACAKTISAARSEGNAGSQEARILLNDLASERLERLHPKFARLIACYLVYKNGSFATLLFGKAIWYSTLPTVSH
jgi:hypothetical protein